MLVLRSTAGATTLLGSYPRAHRSIYFYEKCNISIKAKMKIQLGKIILKIMGTNVTSRVTVGSVIFP